MSEEIKTKESTLVRASDEDYMALAELLDEFRREVVGDDVRFMGLLSTSMVDFSEYLGVTLVGHEMLTEEELAEEQATQFEAPSTVQ